MEGTSEALEDSGDAVVHKTSGASGLMCQQDSTGDHQYFSQPSEQLYKSGSEDTSEINSFLSVSIEKLNHVGQLSGLLGPFLARVYCTVNSDDWLQERGIKTLYVFQFVMDD